MTDADSILDKLKPEIKHQIKILLDAKTFSLRTIFYDPTTPSDVKKVIEQDFNMRVQPRFLQHLVKTGEDTLRSIGIDDHGIECMNLGMLPHDSQGNPYPLNIDHIIDRAGVGVKVTEVNDFENLVLIYRPYHALKTSFTNAQTQGLKESAQILSLAPSIKDEQKTRILVPANMPLEPERLGRPVWVYRAKAASLRYNDALTRLEDTLTDSPSYSDLTLEVKNAAEAKKRMWRWAEAAHKAADPDGYTALSTGTVSIKPQKETTAFFKALADDRQASLRSKANESELPRPTSP